MHVVLRFLSLDTGLAAHKLSVVPHTCSRFLAVALAALLPGCGERTREAETPPPPPPIPAVKPSVAELTGWPAGIGRALVLRLAALEDAFRLVVPELGDRRFADSALSVRVGDSIPVVLLGHGGKVGEAHLRVTDAEAGTGSCVTWPAAEVTAATLIRRRGASEWRIAMERDSVTPIAVGSLAGMSAADSGRLAGAVHAVLADVPALTDSTLRGIPFAILRAYSLSAAGLSVVVAELARTSSSEAAPREQRLFLIGERTGDTQAYHLVHSRDVTGPADSTPLTELLVAVLPRQSRDLVLVLGVEGGSETRLRLVQRIGRRQWRSAWTSVVNFC